MYKRYLSIIMIIVLVFQLCSCGIAGKAKQVGQAIGTGVSGTAKNIGNWYHSIDLGRFRDGWNTAVKYAGSVYATAVSNEYVAQIGTAINSFKADMNSVYGSTMGIAQEAGFVAEKWASGTFNIKAAANNSQYTTNVPGSTTLGSADITTNWDEVYSSKYYQDAKSSAIAQSESLIEAYRDYYNQTKAASKEPISIEEYMAKHGYDPDSQGALLASVYEGQIRIIPTEQLAEASAYLLGRIDKLSALEGDVPEARVNAYQETLANLKDRITAPDGTQSIPLTKEEAQAIAELCEKGEFKPEDFGVSVAQVLPAKYVLKQAAGAGITASVLRTVFTVGPDLVSVIKESLKDGGVDPDAIEELGIEGAISMAEGFVEGSLSSIIVTMCKSGALGDALVEAPSNVVGALVFLTIEAMISGYSLVKGDITLEEYGAMMAERTIITAVSIPSTMAVMAILPCTQVCMLIGGFAGCVIAAIGIAFAKESVVAFVDGGGFGAFVPTDSIAAFQPIKTTVSKLNLNNKLSDLKTFSVSTLSSGLIKIKSIED